MAHKEPKIIANGIELNASANFQWHRAHRLHFLMAWRNFLKKLQRVLTRGLSTGSCSHGQLILDQLQSRFRLGT
jgi:hypothetical protein